MREKVKALRSNIKAKIIAAYNNGKISALYVKCLFSLLKLGDV